MNIVENGKPSLGIYLPGNAGAIERNAAQLLADEVRDRSGVSVPVVEVATWTAQPLRAIALAELGLDINQAGEMIAGMAVTNDEGFAIRTDADVIVLAGKTGAGVLYAVDELLDSLEYSAESVSVPQINVDDAPDCVLRGATFATHDYPRYVDDREQLELMKQLVRSYARNRVNTMTVEATGKRWPGDLSPIVTWKYFPQLQDAAREEMVATRREYINELINYAHVYAVKVILYTAEFNHEPDIYEKCPELHGVLPETWSEGRHNYIRGCICLSKDVAWQYWNAKVREAMEALPELDGLEVWTAEVPSEFGICACPECRKLERHEWLERFYNETRKAMDEVRPDMQLHIKTFQSSQGSLEVERFGPLKGKLPHDSTVVTKAQFGDMAYLNDPHPLLGWIQDGAEVAEFDVGGEYRGCGVGAMICCIPEYIAERMRGYYGKGLRKFYARHLLPNWPNKEFQDINDQAFCKLAWSIDADLETIWQDWARERFGSAVGPKVLEVLKLTDEVVNKSIYIKGACANRHYYVFSDNLDSFRYMMIDLSAQMIEGGMQRLEPTPENIAVIVAEKEEAIEICAAMVEKFEDIADELPEEMRAKLTAIFLRTSQICAVMRYLTEAIFNYFRYERCFSVRERDLMRPRILEMVNRCEEEINLAQKMQTETATGPKFWGISKVIDFGRPRRLCEEIRGNLNFRIGQKAEYTVSVTPIGVGHPNTYSEHRRQLRSIFGLPGEG